MSCNLLLNIWLVFLHINNLGTNSLSRECQQLVNQQSCDVTICGTHSPSSTHLLQRLYRLEWRDQAFKIDRLFQTSYYWVLWRHHHKYAPIVYFIRLSVTNVRWQVTSRVKAAHVSGVSLYEWKIFICNGCSKHVKKWTS